MKNIAPIAVAAMLSACASSHNTQVGGRIVSPRVSDMPAHLELGKRTKGESEIRTFQILWLKFHSDFEGKRVSTNPSTLAVPAYHSDSSGNVVGSPIPGADLVLGKVSEAAGRALAVTEDPAFFLFGSPASRVAALSSARWDAVDASGGDGIIETKAKVDVSGWSLLGIIGFGSAKGYVDGQSFKITPGYKAKPGTLPAFYEEDGKSRSKTGIQLNIGR
jgi:hypothetical protein